MEGVNKIIGNNLIKLRKQAKLTQMELAEKFNYSDKTISKWETGESLPSIDVLCSVAEFYGVTLNDLASEEDITEVKQEKSSYVKLYHPHLIIALMSVSAVWFVAAITYVLLLLLGNIEYRLCFLWAIPASLIALLVFNCIWGRAKYLFPILTMLLWTLFICAFFQFAEFNINVWPMWIAAVPLQAGILLWAALLKKPKAKTENKETKTDVE
ncbi:MAG: helix-turn-helix domain-containing protein [Clostridia bacterium]|nr:helix-turn-helix domain-containing protein [Clostridia bacterium]